eukprot:scaffold8749_cov115-Skeletonema_dohrnii-CCMP3373.AAC.3
MASLSDEEEEFCDECGREMDYLEAEDGTCYDCVAQIKVRRVCSKIPSNYEVRKVVGNHRKGCSDCGKNDWMIGDYYVHDHVQPWGAQKFCLDCADDRDWNNNSDDDDDEDEGLMSLLHSRQQQVVSARASAAAARATSNYLGINSACHTGCPGHPTAGTIYIGGLSSAMINPGMQKIKRDCTRNDHFGRNCGGTIQSFTEDDFDLATCSICCLPSKEAAAKYAPTSNDNNEKRQSAGVADRPDGSNKKQRV